MREKVRISIVDGRGEPFMGIGLVRLLRRVERLGSIRRAAGDMGMSYVKALRILRRLEDALGDAVLDRRRGGASRGGASLTPFGRTFIGEYERYRARVARYARREFSSAFGMAVRRRRPPR
ncbi:MAG: LysR family transcriptional regulator [bacterium]|nr:LysR family transcriptional regulator [bacterium]